MEWSGVAFMGYLLPTLCEWLMKKKTKKKLTMNIGCVWQYFKHDIFLR